MKRGLKGLVATLLCLVGAKNFQLCDCFAVISVAALRRRGTDGRLPSASSFNGLQNFHHEAEVCRYPNPSSGWSSSLFYSRYDSLVSGVAEISIGTSLAVLWSEASIILTGCGPLNLSDGLERFSYQTVIAAAGFSLFTRIVFQADLSTIAQNQFGKLENMTTAQVVAAERLLFSSVVGAVMALAMQIASGANMDGLSGIDVELCRSMRALEALY